MAIIKVTKLAIIKKQSLKKANFKTLSFCQKVFLWHQDSSNIQYVYIVYAKYQMASIKALVQVDFPIHM